MQRASKNGLHRRFYERHRDRVKAAKAEIGKIKRRESPAFGLRAAIAKANRGELSITELIAVCRDAVDKLNAKGS